MLPMTLGEEARQDVPEGTGAIEEPDAADTDRVIPLLREASDDIGCIENKRWIGGCLAAGKARGEEPRMPSGACWGRKKPGKKRLMGGIGKIARRVPLLPGRSRQKRRQVRSLSGTQGPHGDVVA